MTAFESGRVVLSEGTTSSSTLGTNSDFQPMGDTINNDNNGLSFLSNQRPGNVSETTNTGEQQSTSDKSKSLAEIFMLLFALLFGSQGAENSTSGQQGDSTGSRVSLLSLNSEGASDSEQSSPMEKFKKLIELILQLAFGNGGNSSSQGIETASAFR